MTRDKDRKRIVRDRMKKTGESYTAARIHVLAKAGTTPRSNAATASAPSLESRAGVADATIAARTGRTWQEWVRVLDADNAAAMPHRDIARLLRDRHGVGSWWSQSVTVGYERIKGLREPGQRRDGVYEASKSRTFDVPVGRLFRAWFVAATRRRWIGEPATVRTARAPKAMRLQWPDGTLVIAGFTAKGAGRSVVALTHTKLASRAAADGARAAWAARLDALGQLLAARRSPAAATRR